MKNRYYKYRPLYVSGTGGTKSVHPFTESIFTKVEIYYGAPADFNDPFDCNLKVNVSNSTDAEWESWIDDMIVQQPGMASELRNVKATKLWRKNPSMFDHIGKTQLTDHYISSSLFCLSKKNNSIPMFSYYADGHRGIAIEVSFSDQEIPCGISFHSTSANGTPYYGKVVLRDVEYPATFPELNFHRLRNTDKLLRHLIFTKSPEWSHEKEFRIFRRKVPKSAIVFDRTLLTRVVFGCKTEPADIALVKTWLSGWPSDAILLKTEPATDKFELLVNDFEVVKGS